LERVSLDAAIFLKSALAISSNQGCGSGSGFRDFVDPDPYWESGSRGKKTKKISVGKNALFSYFFLIYH
jgi:hypothetical protein